MATKFTIPQRFNMSLAEDGVSFDVFTKTGLHYGAFKCRLADYDSPTWKRETEKVRKELTRKNRNIQPEADVVMRELFLRVILVDWKGIKGADGKDVAYSEDNARDYFNQAGTNFVMNELFAQAQDEANYDEDNKEEVSGN